MKGLDGLFGADNEDGDRVRVFGKVPGDVGEEYAFVGVDGAENLFSPTGGWRNSG